MATPGTFPSAGCCPVAPGLRGVWLCAEPWSAVSGLSTFPDSRGPLAPGINCAAKRWAAICVWRHEAVAAGGLLVALFCSGAGLSAERDWSVPAEFSDSPGLLSVLPDLSGVGASRASKLPAPVRAWCCDRLAGGSAATGDALPALTAGMRTDARKS